MAHDVSAGADMNETFHLSPVPSVILAPSFRIQRVSISFLKALKLTPEECIGLQLFTFLGCQELVADGDNLNCMKQVIDEAIAVRDVRETRVIHTKRQTSWSARVVPIFREGVLLYVVLEWRHLPKATVDPEGPQIGLSTDEAFRILVQTVKDYAIFLLDVNGNVATWNAGAELLKRYKREEIIFKHFSTFYGDEDLKARKPEKELEICLREGRVEDEGWRYRRDGTRFWANVVITAVYKDGVHVGFSKVTRDLTERKAAESRLIGAYEESAKLKSDFLANMSHEIRTPMHGMLSACALLLDTPLTDEQRGLANIIGQSGQVLLQVINNILDYSKLASGNFSINSDVVGVASIITSVVRSVQTTIQPAVHFELYIGSDLPKAAQGDPLRYRQIVQNIVSNAAKFTEKGSIRVQASLLKEDDDDYIILTEVIDTGIGISDAAAKNLFNPFSQFDNTTKKRYKGTGLGRSIAKSLTELMCGQIGFRPNHERQGSIFWFTAKFKKIKDLNQIHGLNAQLAATNLCRPTSPDMHLDFVDRLRQIAPKKRILLAEDNLLNQKVMLKMLQKFGFKSIDTATDGAQVTTMLCSLQRAYDLVLMDINMPIVDGHDATARIRKSCINVPIVAMTAYALKGDREACLEKEMDDYIPKPVEKHCLVRTLVKWLVEEQAEGSGSAWGEGEGS